MSIRAYVARLWTLRGAFRRTFLQPNGTPTNDGQIVLDELRRFCCGSRPVVRNGEHGLDPYATCVVAGRQEVWFRIREMLNLDDSDLHALEKRAQMEDSTDG